MPTGALTSSDQLWVVADGRLEHRTVDVLGRDAEATIVVAFDTADGVVSVPPINGYAGLPVTARRGSALASTDSAAHGSK